MKTFIIDDVGAALEDDLFVEGEYQIFGVNFRGSSTEFKSFKVVCDEVGACKVKHVIPILHILAPCDISRIGSVQDQCVVLDVEEVHSFCIV